MIRTCKQLENKLNELNNVTDIKVVKEHGYYIIKQGGYESEIGYTLKELVEEVANKETIKMVYKYWTMQGMKVTTIKGLN
jgi:hypothetical protein